MKNIVIPLLLANSAKTEAQKVKGMDRDLAVPAPILIADTWTNGACDDTTVTAAATALTNAKSASQKLVDEKKKTQDAAVAAAVTAKKTAVDAVIAKDAAIADKIAADDTEQQKELTLKQALDAATYAKTAAAAAAAAAATAKTAADTAKSGADTVKAAMDTAKTNAGTHYTAEQSETAALKVKRGTAEGDYNTKNSAITNLTSLYDSAKTNYDAKKVTWDTKVQEKADANSKLTKMTTALTTATNDVDAGQSGTAAKLKADAQSTLDGKKSTYDTAGAAWVVKAKLTVAAMKAWVATDVWESKSATNGCKTSVQVALVAGNGSEADCKTQTALKKAWVVDASNVPTGTAFGSGADYAFGYQFGTGECKQATNAYPAAGDAGVSKKCFKRTKSTLAGAVVTANDLSKSGATLDNTWQAALTAWKTQAGVVYAAQAVLDIAGVYKTKVTTSKGTATSTSSTADGAYTTTNGELSPLKSTFDTKDGNLTAGKTAKTTAKATWDSLKAQVTTQEAEEAAQLAIKTLAEGDVTAQGTTVTTLTTAATAAATAKTAADTALTTKTTALGTATTAYNTQVTAAAATATALTTPLSELGTLRATAATATTALATAITNQGGQQKLIDDADKVVKTAKATHLAAVVACKETAYDKYSATLATAEATRATNIKAIEKLIEDNKPKARGKAGARCEKAVSNGTWRPKRDEKTCDTGLCCGAAKVAVGKAMMTIETCQLKDATKYSYVGPRAPMSTTPTAAKSVDFTCIQGAQKLAAVASALAATFYMMA